MASVLPNQPVEANSQRGGGGGGWGSIGPFFGVMSVLTVVCIISCFLGKCCGRGGGGVETPLDSIKGGWVRRRWRRCIAGDVEGGAKVVSFGDDKDVHLQHIETPHT